MIGAISNNMETVDLQVTNTCEWVSRIVTEKLIASSEVFDASATLQSFRGLFPIGDD